MFLVIISFVIFDITSLIDMFNYFKAMFNFNNILIDKTFYYYLIPNTLLLVFAIIASTPFIKTLLNKFKSLRFIILISGLILSTAFLIDSSFNPFLYFRF
ncbi:hypothetical protein SDC9_108234 [bioreactor metagenome]|uniref:Uncharacterized protein n=2 Tax=root TaxID=1 RepID=A0A645B8J2_9ZZZZ